MAQNFPPFSYMILFYQDRYKVDVGERVDIEIVVDNPDGDHLSYDWKLVSTGNLGEDQINYMTHTVLKDKKTTVTFETVESGNLALMYIVSDGSHAVTGFIYISAY